MVSEYKSYPYIALETSTKMIPLPPFDIDEILYVAGYVHYLEMCEKSALLTNGKAFFSKKILN